MSLFKRNVIFLRYNIDQCKIIPINRSIEFASKFFVKITYKTQLQRILGSLNYISPIYKTLTRDTSTFYDRLKKKLVPRTEQHSKMVMKKRLKLFLVFL